MKKMIMMIVALGLIGSLTAQSVSPEDAELRKAIVGVFMTKTAKETPNGSKMVMESMEYFYEDGTFIDEGKITISMNIPSVGRASAEVMSKYSAKYTIDSGIISFTDIELLDSEIVSKRGGEYGDIFANGIMRGLEEQRIAFQDPEQAEKLQESYKGKIVSINEKQMVTQNLETKKKTVHKRVKE